MAQVGRITGGDPGTAFSFATDLAAQDPPTREFTPPSLLEAQQVASDERSTPVGGAAADRPAPDDDPARPLTWVLFAVAVGGAATAGVLVRASRWRPTWHDREVSSNPAEAQRLRDLALLRRVRDRMDREYAQPLDVEALARGVHMSAGHLSRQFRLAYGESPYSYLMTRRIERAMALLRRGDLSVTEVCFAVGCSSLGTFSTRFTELVGHAAERLPAGGGAGDGGDAAVRGEAGHQTGQESRSARSPSRT